MTEIVDMLRPRAVAALAVAYAAECPELQYQGQTGLRGVQAWFAQSEGAVLSEELAQAVLVLAILGS